MPVSRCLPRTSEKGTMWDTAILCHSLVKKCKIKWGPGSLVRLFHSRVLFCFYKFMLAAWRVPGNPHSSSQSGATEKWAPKPPASSMNPTVLRPHWCGQGWLLPISGPPGVLRYCEMDSEIPGRSWQMTSGSRARSLETSGVPIPRGCGTSQGRQPQVVPY